MQSRGSYLIIIQNTKHEKKNMLLKHLTNEILNQKVGTSILLTLILWFERFCSCRSKKGTLNVIKQKLLHYTQILKLELLVTMISKLPSIQITPHN